MNKPKGFARTLFSYACGAFGHDVFYAALSSYLIMFITSQLFNPGQGTISESTSEKMIAIVTTALFVLRFVELIIDPMIGGVIDNTRSRIGKFKPWILFGGVIGSICIVALFTDLGGLSTANPMMYVVMFIVIFAVLDVVYSFKDIAFWGMIPALATDSSQRESVGVFARIASTLGAAAVTVSVVPIVRYFSAGHTQSGNAIGDKQGWLVFAVLVAVVSLAGGLITVFGAREQQSALRKPAEKTSILQVFRAIGRNDQLMWLAVSYGLFALGYVLCSSFLLYYFTYIYGVPEDFAIIGTINLVLGFVAVALFPPLSRLAGGRKRLFLLGVAVMIAGLAVFAAAGQSLPLILTGYIMFFFPYPIMFVCVLLMLTDSVEYGQLKTGTRSEGVTLCVRPLLDKMAGAISNGVVGFTAIWVGMTNNATVQTVAAGAGNVFKFKLIMFGLPAIMFVLSIVICLRQVRLTEEFHRQVVDKLCDKLGISRQDLTG
ncbi:MAG: glycoside-pentoside-hexuronide (GPH):cation symporter [Negativicutes bacterium]|nr:glycoside-pentoside-hexuronide (GPH):cation symporter [Negativicutes bacterium]